jgi:ribose 5-phosphate isomerase A
MVNKKYDPVFELIKPGDVVGLGSGRAAADFVRELAQRVTEGLVITGVPTSVETEALARSLGIPLAPTAGFQRIDIAVDGADEVDPALNLIKGYGGALVREKIIAKAALQFVVLVGPEKLVKRLGARGKLPIEVVRFGWMLTRQHLAALGLNSQLRTHGDSALISDNGNLILDCVVSAIQDPFSLERSIHEIPGVVGTGLFINLANLVFVMTDNDVTVMPREERADG